jgi:hypothetical protein
VPERRVFGTFDDDRGDAETLDFNAADQTIRSSDRRYARMFENLLLPMLKHPGVRYNETAITQHQNCAGEESPLSPLKSRAQRRSSYDDFHWDAWIRR